MANKFHGTLIVRWINMYLTNLIVLIIKNVILLAYNLLAFNAKSIGKVFIRRALIWSVQKW